MPPRPGRANPAEFGCFAALYAPLPEGKIIGRLVPTIGHSVDATTPPSHPLAVKPKPSPYLSILPQQSPLRRRFLRTPLAESSSPTTTDHSAGPMERTLILVDAIAKQLLCFKIRNTLVKCMQTACQSKKPVMVRWEPASAENRVGQPLDSKFIVKGAHDGYASKNASNRLTCLELWHRCIDLI